jgi:glucose-1-phosphate adenylyltransferase
MVFDTLLFVLGVEAFSRPGRVESGYFSRVNGRGEADAHVDRAVIGIRSVIGSGTTDPQLDPYGGRLLPGRSLGTKARRPTAGIGRHCRIEGAIIDKNAYIEDGVVITSEGKSKNADGENYYIRDGVVVVPKGAVIPAGPSI